MYDVCSSQIQYNKLLRRDAAYNFNTARTVYRSSKNNLKVNYITHLTPSSGANFEYFWNLYDRCTRTGLPFCQLVDSFPFLSLNLALQLCAIAALDFVNFWSEDSSAVLLLPLRSQPPEPEKKCKKKLFDLILLEEAQIAISG